MAAPLARARLCGTVAELLFSRRAISRRGVAGHEPVLLVPTMQWLFPSHCLANADDELSNQPSEDFLVGRAAELTPSESRRPSQHRCPIWQRVVHRLVCCLAPTCVDLLPQMALNSCQSFQDCTFGRGGYSREILSRLSEEQQHVYV